MNVGSTFQKAFQLQMIKATTINMTGALVANDAQSIRGSTFERRSIWSNTDSTAFGIGSTTVSSLATKEFLDKGTIHGDMLPGRLARCHERSRLTLFITTQEHGIRLAG